MDRGILGERRPGHVDEQLALDGWQIADGYHIPTAMRRMSTGRRPIPDRIAVHIQSLGVFVVLGVGYVLPIFERLHNALGISE